MGDMLSQDEIDALLNGVNIEDSAKDDGAKEDSGSASAEETLNAEEKDAVGEIGNISMGTSATTLYALLGQKVTITAPHVKETTWDELARFFVEPYVAVRVKYTEGLKGMNILIIKEDDVKVIADLMMGGDGHGNIQGELTDFHLSAISEAMNQMVGSSATSLSSIFDKRVDISPPESVLVESGSGGIDKIRIDQNSHVVAVQFTLKVGDLIDSQIIQIMPISFAREMSENLLKHARQEAETPAELKRETPRAASNAVAGPAPMQPNQPQQNIPQPGLSQQYQQPQAQPMGQMPSMPNQIPHQPAYSQNPINVQPAQFQSFGDSQTEYSSNNIGILMDVPLQVAVELGRTTKRIKEILDFGQGSIIELDKLAGENVDILVNGKVIAKGEVVVIDESFGVRITDIIHPSKRL